MILSQASDQHAAQLASWQAARLSTGAIAGGTLGQIILDWGVPFENNNYTCTVGLDASDGLLQIVSYQHGRRRRSEL